MKAVLLSAALALTSVGLGLVGTADAATPNGHSYYFYSGTQLIGQSILYCNNLTQHWGEAVGTNLANAVSVTYPCSTGTASNVGYGSNVDATVRANFCNTVDACSDGPIPAGGPLERGLYSN